ncbi:transmembrane protein [Gossypium australe]|uniref:Transmembrane protein n=1 Tax=Gossypium australe TaxID=47621 RepID=A0A5B6W5L6_9ROSI|nr:transmembrane protein [Gossypium australe]
MFLISCPSGALSAKKCSLKFTVPIQPSISNSSIHKRPKFIPSRNPRKPLQITLAKAEGGLDSAPKQSSPPPPPTPSPFNNGDDTVFVGQDDVPLEGVIQFEKPSSSSRLSKWGRVALLAGGDVLALLLFSAIGRYNHGLPIFAMDTIRTADPFLAGIL